MGWNWPRQPQAAIALGGAAGFSTALPAAKASSVGIMRAAGGSGSGSVDRPSHLQPVNDPENLPLSPFAGSKPADRNDRDYRLPAEPAAEQLVSILRTRLGYVVQGDIFEDAHTWLTLATVVYDEHELLHLLTVPRQLVQASRQGTYELQGLKTALELKDAKRVVFLSHRLNAHPSVDFLIEQDRWRDSGIDMRFIPWQYILELQNAHHSDRKVKGLLNLRRPVRPLAARAARPAQVDIPYSHQDSGHSDRLPRQELPLLPLPDMHPSDTQDLISVSEEEWIVAALAKQATAYPQGSNLYYRKLLKRIKLPRDWSESMSDPWTGDARADAQALVGWAKSKGQNPSEPGCTVLGSVLTAFLGDQGLEERAITVALIYLRRLYTDQRLLDRLATRYQIPSPEPIPPANSISPDPRLPELTSDAELQGLLNRDLPLLDIGFLSQAIQRAAGICRVETSRGEPLGTGFLVGPQNLLTNQHVIELAPGSDLQTKAENLVLRFGSITAADGSETEGRTYRPDPEHPLLYSSSTDRLDYALLQLEPRDAEVDGLCPIQFIPHEPLTRGTGINMLGHPQGGPMKLAISNNAVTRIDWEKGLVQYVTRALSGSSGSPCFDDDWKLIALHHAERARYFGAVREGVLLKLIFDDVQGLI